MRKILSLSIFLFFGFSAFCQNPVFTIELFHNGVQEWRLGDEITVSLKINDSTLINALKGDDVLHEKYQMTNPMGFSTIVSITALDTGIINLGPYEIDYRGKKLKSNVLTLHVLPKVEEDYVEFLAPSKATLNSNGTISIRSNNGQVKDMELNESEYFKITGNSYSGSETTINGKKTKFYLKKFEVQFIKKGELVLTKNILKNANRYSRKVVPLRITID